MKISLRDRTFRDVCLIFIFLLVSLLLYFVVSYGGKLGRKVVVSVDGVQIGEYSLVMDGEYALNDGSNILVVEDGSARVISANCPNKLCVKQGVIRYTGQCITCLPNKLTVTVVGGDDSVDIVL